MMITTLRFIVVVLLCHGLLHCHAQTYTSIHYTVSEGLPSNEVYEVFQDRSGFLWFGTDNGVVRYDGYEMVRFGIEDGLTDPVVFGFHEDKKGRIWFRTFSGRLSYFEDGNIYPYRYNDVITKFITRSIISSLYVDSLDQLWFGTFRNYGVYGMIDTAGQAKTKAPGDAILYYEEEGDRVLYGYQQFNLEYALIQNKKYYVPKLAAPDDYGCDISHVFPIRWKGKLYISMCSRIFEFDGKALRRVYTGRGSIISLYVDQDDDLWVGYRSAGIEKFSDTKFIQQPVPKFLKDMSVSKVFQDNHSGFWFSTLEQGIFHVPNIHVVNQTLDDQIIQYVATGADDIYMGTNTGDVFRIRGYDEPKLFRKFTPPLKGLYVDKNEYLWVTSAYQSDRFNLRNPGPPHAFKNSLTNAMADRNGNLYTVSGGSMVAIIRPNLTVEQISLPFMCRNVFVQDTSLFIVSRSGLHISDLDLKQVREVPALSDFKINGILKINDSTLLLTTIGRGFIVFDTDDYSFVNYHAGQKFAANNIYSALQLGRNLWFGTENGLVKLKLVSLFSDTPNFDVLTKQNGLAGTQITYLAYQGNRIFAFSDNGYSIFDETISRYAGQTPVFYLKSLQVNSQEIPHRFREVDFPFDKNNVQIQFGFISLDKQVLFIRHRLAPDLEWNYTDQKSLQYLSLSPGKYEIEIQFSPDNINWLRGLKTGVINISAPLWRTWYFIAGAVLLLTLLVFLFFRNRMMIFRKHQQRLIQSEIQTIERERTRIAKDLHDSVGTDFSAMKMIVSQLLRKHQDPQVEEVETQFQNSLQEIKSIIYGLAPPGLERYGLMTGIRNYTEKINGKVPTKITINTFGNEVKDPALSISVFRIIQELISNSLKHSGAKSISIHINAFEDLLNVVYEDNGKGFSWNDSRNGAGLFNIESRVQSINGQLKFDSTQYGVSYTIDIPLPKTNLAS